jgi:alcohol dehydrogenase class IV
MMNFEFATANRIIFGPGTINRIGQIVEEIGERTILLSGLPSEILSPIQSILEKAGVAFISIQVEGEPTVESIRSGLYIAQQFRCNSVIGIGGGSALDSAKAIAILINNPGDMMDYLEVVGGGQKIKNAGVPFIAIPTTAGTGSEVTSNAVIGALLPGQAEKKVKVSLRSPLMLARLALIDPELTLTLPVDVTAATGLDALTQLIEPFVSNRANPMTDSVCREGMKLAARSIRTVCHDGLNYPAREKMALASLFGGLALANAKLGAVHGLAGVIGGLYPAPHGAVCAKLLPYVMEANIQAIRKREPGNPALERYQEIGKILTGTEKATPEDSSVWIFTLTTDLNVAPLAQFGMQQRDFPRIVEQAALASSMLGNPIKLTNMELEGILQLAL